MKVYLHGGRAGQTFNIKGVQFINGVAEVATLSKYLERYYNVKDYPPDQENADGLQIKEETKKEVNYAKGGFIENMPPCIVGETLSESVAQNATNEVETTTEDLEFLRQVVESKKKEIESNNVEDKPSLIDQMHEFNNWGQMRAFVKSVTGIDVNSKKKAIEVLTEFESKKVRR